MKVKQIERQTSFMSKLKSILFTLGIAAGIMLVPVANSSAGTIPCSYGNYFDSNGNRIKPVPVVTVGSQKGNAWCVGYRAYYHPTIWSIIQRDYELTMGR